MKAKFALSLLTTAVAGAFLFSSLDSATGEDFARDPGVRGGAPGAGGPISGLSANELRFFLHGKEDFEELEEVDEGLGPTMNLNGCGGCHSQPATGGTSPAVNPQVAFAQRGRPSQLPAVDAFIRSNGPVREARFVRNPDGTPDGGVHALFTITGRPGGGAAATCGSRTSTRSSLRNNVIFRIPTPVFGAGLIEQIPDRGDPRQHGREQLRQGRARHPRQPNLALSGRTITGSTNRNGNDGTIARFGWKAQNQSLLLVLRRGLQRRDGHHQRAVPDRARRDAGLPVRHGAQRHAELRRRRRADRHHGDPELRQLPALPGAADAVARHAGRLVLDRPRPRPVQRPSAARCATRRRSGPATRRCSRCATSDANLFSDLLLHDMGAGLADGVTQGEAGPREFRTAPLWGLGQRIFFLHDGRTADLKVAIREHMSEGSEANGVIRRFNDLRESQKQDLLNFLRSL